ncbi:PLD nuclease N-terminal domain-containing protein [Aeromicrobium sp. Root236]|uniref:PLD nuclease N-terminal domain-containing protein n=1 Tax=Aeromicrobium sp. Root236 TaxID=1736498 RepID=UPI000A94E66C|nr:PLD nuclease N-terminal domain-containing protein [Aeromicrobium sp. Root236]
MGDDDVLLMDGALGLVILGLWIFCLLDVISTDEYACRNLSKVWWLILVLFFPLVGSIAWLVAGRPESSPTASMPYKGNHGHPSFPEYDRPGRAVATNPEDDEAFLRSLRERAEEQRRAYRETQRELTEKQRRELEEGDSTAG